MYVHKHVHTHAHPPAAVLHHIYTCMLSTWTWTCTCARQLYPLLGNATLEEAAAQATRERTPGGRGQGPAGDFDRGLTSHEVGLYHTRSTCIRYLHASSLDRAITSQVPDYYTLYTVDGFMECTECMQLGVCMHRVRHCARVPLDDHLHSMHVHIIMHHV